MTIAKYCKRLLYYFVSPSETFPVLLENLLALEFMLILSVECIEVFVH